MGFGTFRAAAQMASMDEVRLTLFLFCFGVLGLCWRLLDLGCFSGAFSWCGLGRVSEGKGTGTGVGMVWK